MLDSQHRLGRGVHTPLPANVVLRRATVADCTSLAPRLRQADKDEVVAACGLPSTMALPLSLRPSTFVACVDGTPEMIFGVSPSRDEGVGHPWMLASPVPFTPQWRIVFLRHGRAHVEEWQRRYRLLHNFIDARNEAHLKWLRWLGFKIIARHDRHGPLGLPFYEFIRTAPCA